MRNRSERCSRRRRCSRWRAAPTPARQRRLPRLRDAHASRSVRFGVVESVREVRIDPADTGVGTRRGAMLGGIAGSTVGGGSGPVAGADRRRRPGRHHRLQRREGRQRARRASRSRCCSTAASTSPSCRKPTRPSASAIACASSRGAAPRASRTEGRPRAPAGPAPRLLRRRALDAASTAPVAAAFFSCASSGRAPTPSAARDRDALVRRRPARDPRRRACAPRAGTRRAGARRAMIAANHVSWLDIFAIASLRHTRFIAKSEIRDWPLAGWLAEKSGTIFIRRARRHDTARINALVHEALGEGDCVGLFPEGTTTEGDRAPQVPQRALRAGGGQSRPRPSRWRCATSSPTERRCRDVAYVGDLLLRAVARARHPHARDGRAPRLRRADRAPTASRGRRVALEAHRARG